MIIEKYIAGKGWETAQRVERLSQFDTSARSALRLRTSDGCVLARTRAAGLVEEAVAALERKIRAKAVKGTSGRELSEMEVITEATAFHVCYRSEPSLRIEVRKGDWQAALIEARERAGASGVVYAVSGGRQICVEAGYTIEKIISSFLVK